MGRFRLTAWLALAVPCALALALASGSADLSPGQVWAALAGEGPSSARTVVLELRLPRALNGFAVGGLLALAGVLLQTLLRNPLADPYVLGLSGGAGVGALSAWLLGVSARAQSACAFAGALLSTFLVFGLSRRGGAWTPTRLLLTGVIVAAGWGALISFMLSVGAHAGLPAMLFWLMGDLSRPAAAAPGLVLLAAATLLAIGFGRGLNQVARGELRAAALGVRVDALRIGIYLLASLLTATAVTLAGGVGFVGLVIPHAARLLGGSDHRTLAPNAVLLGGVFLVLADTLARTALAPQQLPVGVITALLGVPAFLYLLARGRGRTGA